MLSLTLWRALPPTLGAELHLAHLVDAELHLAHLVDAELHLAPLVDEEAAQGDGGAHPGSNSDPGRFQIQGPARLTGSHSVLT
jgi:hypothetical protein